MKELNPARDVFLLALNSEDFEHLEKDRCISATMSDGRIFIICREVKEKEQHVCR